MSVCLNDGHCEEVDDKTAMIMNQTLMMLLMIIINEHVHHDGHNHYVDDEVVKQVTLTNEVTAETMLTNDNNTE